jgi:hypothetical protein
VSGPSDAPIACQLKALDSVERARQKELLGIIRGKIRRTVELERGFEIELPSDPESFMQTAEWVNLERRCCAFAEFAILAAGADRVLVRATGGEGAREVLAAEMGIAAGV